MMTNGYHDDIQAILTGNKLVRNYLVAPAFAAEADTIYGAWNILHYGYTPKDPVVGYMFLAKSGITLWDALRHELAEAFAYEDNFFIENIYPYKKLGEIVRPSNGIIEVPRPPYLIVPVEVMYPFKLNRSKRAFDNRQWLRHNNETINPVSLYLPTSMS